MFSLGFRTGVTISDTKHAGGEVLRVLAAGRAGYVGSVLCERLLKAGRHATAVDNLMYGHHGPFRLCTNPCFEFVCGDARDRDLLRGLLVLMACWVGPGDELIATSFTFVGTSGAVAWVGAKPLFVDIKPDTHSVRPQLIEAAQKARVSLWEAQGWSRSG
jgi:hypothetical protein